LTGRAAELNIAEQQTDQLDLKLKIQIN